MSEWKKATLSQVAEIIGGFAFKGEHFSDDGDSTVIKIKDIQAPFINIDGATKVFMESYSQDKLEKFLLKRGDFALAMTGATIGKIGKLIGDKQAYINQRVAKIDPHGDVSKEFVYYCIRGDDFQVFIQNNIDSHSAQENISSTSIGRYPIDLPYLPEQKAIAEVLCSLDDKINLLHRQNKTLESLAETLFRQWFVEEAQDDWRDGVLSDEFLFTMGQSPAGSSFNEDGIGVPMFQGNADFGFRFPTERVYTTEPTRYAKKLDTLISVRAPVGAQNMAHKECCIGRGVAAFRYKNNPNYYTYTYFKLRSLMIEISQFNDEGTVFGSISKSDFESLRVMIPPEALILKYESEVKPLNDKIIANCQSISVLEKIRDTLLPKLMSGEVRVQYQEAV